MQDTEPDVFRRVAKRQRAERDVHTVVVQVDAKAVPKPTDWWSDLRRGHLRVLGGTFRTIDVLVQQGRRDLAVTLAEVVLAYAQDNEERLA